MKLLQVKDYHNKIALPKHSNALDFWRSKKDGYGYPIKSMFYFMINNSFGLPDYERKKGWVAFNDTKLVWGKNKIEAEKKFFNVI